MNRTYRGVRTNDEISVIVTQGLEGGDSMTYPLSAEWSQKIRNHSPDGFNWGYHGSGPAQLALAILLDASNSMRYAKRLYQPFKDQFVATWGDRWEITSDQILSWIAGSAMLLSRSHDEDTPTLVESKEVPHGG